MFTFLHVLQKYTPKITSIYARPVFKLKKALYMSLKTKIHQSAFLPCFSWYHGLSLFITVLDTTFQTSACEGTFQPVVEQIYLAFARYSIH